MVSRPFYERDGQIRLELEGASVLFTTAACGDLRQTHGQLARALGLRIAYAHQVHGDTVLELGSADRPYGPDRETAGDADALIATVPDLAPMVISADCLPIVIAAARHGRTQQHAHAAIHAGRQGQAARAVAAVHAGWRGLRAGVIGKTLERLRALAPEAALEAAIGPAAGVCCYEVGEEVHQAFAQVGQDLRAGPRLDLKAIARAQLRRAGVEVVYDVGLCTICSDPSALFSHRRDHGQTGRQGALAWLS